MFVVLAVALQVQGPISVLDPIVNAPAVVFKGIHVSVNDASADKMFLLHGISIEVLKYPL